MNHMMPCFQARLSFTGKYQADIRKCGNTVTATATTAVSATIKRDAAFDGS
jgi:hypothetical protein